jgi:hypothetical protein
METSTHTATPVALNRLVRHPFPDYGVEVEATAIDGKMGVWSHGQYGWYPQGKWGIKEYPHNHITSWMPLPNIDI